MTASSELHDNGHSPSVFDYVSQEVKSRSDNDQAFWWRTLAQSMASFFEACQYAEQEQLYYLRWFHDWVLPSLGPSPVEGKPFQNSWFTHDGSPLEYSLNWKQSKSNQLVRFTVEPFSRDVGTAADPFGRQVVKSFLRGMAQEVPGIGLTRFDHFLSEIVIPEEAAKDRSTLPSDAPRTHVLVAFDLEGGKVMAKAYFLPLLRSIYTGVPQLTIAFDAFRKCNGPDGSYDPSIAALENHFQSFEAGKNPNFVNTSIDCVDAPGARLKLYVEMATDTLAKAKDMYSLGGKLSGPTTEGSLKAISEFWCHLFGLSSADAEHTEVLTGGAKAVFAYEMRPAKEGVDKPDIEVKLHLPVWRVGKTDAELIELLSAWFQSHGADKLAARYQRDLAGAFPKHDLGTSVGVHTWLSITYTPKTGLYMTMYYTPKLPETDYPLGQL